MFKSVSLKDEVVEKTIQECLNDTNPKGRFQLIVIALSILATLASGYVTFQMQSLSVLPEVSLIFSTNLFLVFCLSEGCKSAKGPEEMICTLKRGLDWEFSSELSNYVTEFDLYCDRKYLISLGTTLYFVGFFFAYFTSTQLSFFQPTLEHGELVCVPWHQQLHPSSPPLSCFLTTWMFKSVSLKDEVVEKTIQECLNDTNPKGRFQLIVIALSILATLASGYVTFQMQSLSVLPEVFCLSEECKSSQALPEDMICTLKRGKDWEFSGERSNYVTEFDLYCDNKYLISLGTTLYFVGFFFAVSPLSSVVDKMGRKFSTELWILLYIIFLGLSSLVSSISELLAVRMCLGALHGGISISSFVLFYEFTSASVATLAMMVSSAAFSMGGGVAGLVAMVSPCWQQTMALPAIIFAFVGVIFHFLMPETPHWLFSKGMERNALTSLNRIARFNGYPILKNVQLVSATGQSNNSKKGQSFGILWSIPFFRRSLLYFSFCWFTVSICFYGLEFNAATLGNEYLVMMLMGCSDFPFKVSLYFLASSMGRQKSSQLYLSLGLACLVLTGIPQTDHISVSGNFTLKTMLVVSGRAFSGAVFALLYIYTSEILPTLVRSVGMSTCSTCARVGSLLAPLVILVNEISPSIIYVFIVVCLMISMGLLRNIPETLGRPLPNCAEDCLEMFGESRDELESLTKSFTVSVCYYGLEFNASTLGNEYLVMILMGCFDFPFKMVLYVLAGKIGRQKSCQLYLSLGLICLILTAIPQTDYIPISGNFTMKTMLVASGRAFSGAVFALLYIYTSEILPTLVRSVGMSTCSTCARVGSLLAPLVILVNEISPSIIYVFIVVCLMISMGLLRNIPETLGRPLPNCAEDCLEMFGEMIRDRTSTYIKSVSLNDEVVEKTIQECLNDTNPKGRFQLIVIALCTVATGGLGYITFQMQSLSVLPEIFCLSEECKLSTDEDEVMICTLNRGLDWEFSSERSNYVTEFDLYCDNKYLISLGTTFYFVGFFFAVSPLSAVVDRLGRKVSSELFFFFLIVFLCLSTLVSNIWQVLLLRVCLGAVFGGASISNFILGYEFTSASVATFTTLLSSAAFSMGGGLAGFVAMVSPCWQHSMIPPSFIFAFVGLAYHFHLSETPHWLFSKGLELDAVCALNRIARFNGYQMLNNFELVSATGQSTDSKRGQSFVILWSTPFFRRSLICLSFCWFTISVCYYGLEFNASTLGNEYLSGNFTMKTMLVASGRAFSGGLFALIYIYTSEILPTLVRSVGMSTCSTCARVGSLLAPLVVLVNEISPSIVYVFIVVCEYYSYPENALVMLKGISLNDDREEKTIEECIAATNPRGRFQVIILSLLVVECIASGYVTFQMQSLAVLPEIICKTESCLNSKLEGERSNYVTEFDLYCDNKYLISLGTTFYFVGFFFAVSPLSSLVDKYPAFKPRLDKEEEVHYNLAANSLATNIWLVLAARTLLGAMHGGASIALFIISYEFTTESIATFTAMMTGAAFSMGGGVAGLVALASSHWQYTMIVPAGIFALVGAIFHFILPETPHWLFSKGYKQEALNSLNFISQFNGYQRLENIQLISPTGHAVTNKQGQSFGILWSTPFFRRSLICLSFCWFTVSVCYYGLEFNASTLGNEYLVMILTNGMF
eukprot:sb/3460759/